MNALWTKVLSDAQSGNLFVCHIAFEAKSLKDTQGLIPKLRESFRFKDSYEPEIRSAADLGWFIIRQSNVLPGKLATKRVAWCVRTILIARCAERREPVFSASALSKSSGNADVRLLIRLKIRSKLTPQDIERFSAFLVEQIASDPVRSGDLDSYAAHFERSENKVALQTLNAGLDYI